MIELFKIDIINSIRNLSLFVGILKNAKNRAFRLNNLGKDNIFIIIKNL